LNEHPAFQQRGRVQRFAPSAAIALVLLACVATLLQAQISEADKKKRDAFLKGARGDAHGGNAHAERFAVAERKAESGHEKVEGRQEPNAVAKASGAC
jgi:Na+-translocating ferredoxin:NAD+ oxidoreductase RnfG subunit